MKNYSLFSKDQISLRNSYYKYAYCAYYQKNYTDAENLFKGFLGVFPNSSRAEEIAYMHALTYYKQSPNVQLDQTNTNKAIGMMQGFINTYPNSPRVADANKIIEKCRAKLEEKDYLAAKLYYNLQMYQAAGIAFTNLLNSYPESQKAILICLWQLNLFTSLPN